MIKSSLVVYNIFHYNHLEIIRFHFKNLFHVKFASPSAKYYIVTNALRINFNTVEKNRFLLHFTFVCIHYAFNLNVFYNIFIDFLKYWQL